MRKKIYFYSILRFFLQLFLLLSCNRNREEDDDDSDHHLNTPKPLKKIFISSNKFKNVKDIEPKKISLVKKPNKDSLGKLCELDKYFDSKQKLSLLFKNLSKNDSNNKLDFLLDQIGNLSSTKKYDLKREILNITRHIEPKEFQSFSDDMLTPNFDSRNSLKKLNNNQFDSLYSLTYLIIDSAIKSDNHSIFNRAVKLKLINPKDPFFFEVNKSTIKMTPLEYTLDLIFYNPELAADCQDRIEFIKNLFLNNNLKISEENQKDIFSKIDDAINKLIYSRKFFIDIYKLHEKYSINNQNQNNNLVNYSNEITKQDIDTIKVRNNNPKIQKMKKDLTDILINNKKVNNDNIINLLYTSYDFLINDKSGTMLSMEESIIKRIWFIKSILSVKDKNINNPKKIINLINKFADISFSASQNPKQNYFRMTLVETFLKTKYLNKEITTNFKQTNFELFTTRIKKIETAIATLKGIKLLIKNLNNK